MIQKGKNSTLYLKAHLMVVFGDLGVKVKIRNCSFVLGNPGFQRSLRLAVVYKITVVAADFVYCARFQAVNIILCLWTWKQTAHKLARLFNVLPVSFLNMYTVCFSN